jgi:hypothetical protein
MSKFMVLAEQWRNQANGEVFKESVQIANLEFDENCQLVYDRRVEAAVPWEQTVIDKLFIDYATGDIMRREHHLGSILPDDSKDDPASGSRHPI